MVGRFLDKNQRDALDASLGQMDVTEELRVCGIASISGARGADSTDTYYLITNQGTYFARARKTGFMKKEVSPEFVAHADITHSDYINDAAVILRCYRGGGDHFLAFSFYLSASHGGEQAELAKVASAMGRAPVDVTYEVIPAARYR